MPTHTVLVVDDDENIRDAVRMTLEDAGYAVLEAPNGAVGLNVLRMSNEALVVLLDLMMPIMSGLEVLRAVGSEPAIGARHAFILFSAARAFAPATLNRYLPSKRLFDVPKPFDIDDLVAIVEQAARQLDTESEHEEHENEGEDEDDNEGEGAAVVSTLRQRSDAEGTPDAT